MEKKKTKRTLKIISALLVTIFFATMLLPGCVGGKVSSIKFNVQKMELVVGEEREITGSVVSVSPTFADNKEFLLSTDKPNILSVSGNKITALSSGKATLTATSKEGGKTADCVVYVYYSPIKTLALNVTGDTEQVVGSLSEVSFMATCNESVDPKTEIKWFVNDALSVTQTLSNSFTFLPKSSGMFNVRAEVKDDEGQTLARSVNVAVFNPISPATVSFDETKLTQKLIKFQAVEFAASYTENAGDPPSIVKWYVDDVLMATGSDTFSFLPKTPGTFKVGCVVNGIVSTFNGANFVTVIAQGVVSPTNITVDFDNCFPKVYARWEGMPQGLDYTIKIVDRSTGNEVAPNFSTKNPLTKSLFTDNSADISSFVNDGNANIFSTQFDVSVKSDGDKNGIYSESDFSAPVTTKKISSAARAYLGKSYYDGEENYFISSEREFFNIFNYLVLWRVTKADFYLDYSIGVSASQYAHDMLDLLNLVGYYQTDANLRNNIYSINFNFLTDLTPTKSASLNTASAKPINAMQPHVNYDEQKALGENYTLPIERKEKVTVENTEQLYYIAQAGYCPKPVFGSAAAKYYNYAENLLKSIISVDMTDYDIVHAIYDWIMWRVIYDHYTVENYSTKSDGSDNTPEAIKFSCYYIEGVLTDSNYLAVCDGMSKAFSLLCNMMGIPCYRVGGEAESGGGRGGHAWNKALVDGKWYIFDCTWGDANINGRELATHDYMFLTDAQVAASHFQDKSIVYPKTTTTAYNWYDKDFQFSGKNMDFYLSSNATIESECSGLVDYIIGTKPAGNNRGDYEYYVGALDANNNKIKANNVVVDSYGIEIKVHSNLSSQFISDGRLLNNNPIKNAFRAKGYREGVNYSLVAINGIDSSINIMIYLTM